MPIMAILVVGKCSANFGRQILGKALEFLVKDCRNHFRSVVLPQIRILIGLGRKTNLVWQISRLKISRTSVVMYCHIVRMAFLNCQDVS